MLRVKVFPPREQGLHLPDSVATILALHLTYNLEKGFQGWNSGAALPWIIRWLWEERERRRKRSSPIIEKKSPSAWQRPHSGTKLPLKWGVSQAGWGATVWKKFPEGSPLGVFPLEWVRQRQQSWVLVPEGLSSEHQLMPPGKGPMCLGRCNWLWKSGRETQSPYKPGLSPVFALVALTNFMLWMKVTEILEVN